MKKLLTLLALLAGFSPVYAQPQFKYKITYNTSQCAYEARVVLTGGTFNGSIGTRLPAAMTFTIAVPSNYGDQNFTITSVAPNGATWVEGNGFRAPNAAPGFDYHPVAYGGGGPTNALPVMNLNDELVLFRFTVGLNKCGTGMRPYNNGGTPTGDPTSSQFLSAGDAGNSIDNSFQLSSAGGPVDYYTGNLSGSTTLPAPVVTSTNYNLVGAINVTASATAGGPCNNVLSYAWTGPNSYTGTTLNFSRSSGNLANFGTYNLTVTDNQGCAATAALLISTLPIKLIAFNGNADKCSAHLAWEVAEGEKDFTRFEVQYSNDGSRYVTVGQVERNPYNNNYSFTYVQPSGKAYYRLKIIDQAGKSSYSETVPVATTCDRSEITLAPNPTASISTVSGITAGDQIKVTDVLGNVVANYISGGTNATIDLGVYPSAIYNVIISRNGDILKAVKLTKL